MGEIFFIYVNQTRAVEFLTLAAGFLTLDLSVGKILKYGNSEMKAVEYYLLGSTIYYAFQL